MEKLAIAGGRPVTESKPAVWPIIGENDKKNLLEVFESGKWWYGEKVHQFEAEYAAFQTAKYGISCMNGSLALELGLLACGISEGDEVIVPPYTFLATATAVIRVNAVPVFADISLSTCNLDPADVERKITSRTKAIIPVHFAGLPADMDALKAIAQKHNLRIIEDACHSWGSQWKGKGTGAIGDCGAFSFQMSKNITAGEGGILLTDDEKIAELARSHSNCGRLPNRHNYEHYLPGSNMRMTELQAAILLAQLTRLEEQTMKREENAAILSSKLTGIPGIALMERDERVTRRSHHMYILRMLPEEWPGVSRELFLKALQAEGVSIWVGYPIPLYKNPLFAAPEKRDFDWPFYSRNMDYSGVVCPNAERICEEACWIPQTLLLGESKDMQDIANAIEKVWEQKDSLASIGE